MKIDEKQISHVSNLARLNLSDQEKGEFSKQLTDIITYVEKINELNTETIEATDHIVDLKNVVREDSAHDFPGRAPLEKIAPEFENGHVVVPKIIE